MSDENTKVVHEELDRGLQERHIQLIALGGAIGVGLFLGSATAIEKAGPGVVVAYMIAGLAVFFVMRAMGEITVEYPVSGSFSAHAYQFLNPLAGYVSGWNYWYVWVVTCMAEITAVGVYVHLWLPDLPQWISCLCALGLMTCANLISVKAYGEFEFWFALIKIITIIFLILTGAGMIFFGLGNGGVAVGVSNLTSHGGFFPHGFGGVFDTLLMVLFAYVGIEVIGVTAGEAHNPEKTLSSAIDKVLYRILLFYVLALLVIMAIYPWDQIGHQGSPFVMVFEELGISGAANIINFVVITAALSSCNSGIYSTSRMLYNLSLQGTAPKAFSVVSKHQVPYRCICISVFFMLIGVILNYFLPATVFEVITSVSAFACMVTWMMILFCQMSYRKQLSPEEKKHIRYKMPWSPYSNYFTLAFFAVVLLSACFHPNTRVGIFATAAWLVGLIAVYYIAGFNKRTTKIKFAHYEGDDKDPSNH
ncbi:MAG: amino acid permease [Megasphaera sp.]|jgi:L-asparagine transporter-like permease|nr:amino acid permease [Megasphaera sp.]